MNFDNVSVSELFKKAREEQGLNIKEIASDICVQSRYLEAIESGDFQKLPEQTFAFGFVRSYARALNIDAAAALTAFKAEIGAEVTQPIVTNASPAVTKAPAKKGVPSWLSPLAGLLGAAGVWVWMSGGMATLSYSQAYETSVEEAQLAAVTAQLEQSPIESVATEAKAAKFVEPPVDLHDSLAVETLTSSATSLFLPAAHADEAKQQPSHNNQILLEAVEDSWVRIGNPDGTEIWSGILRQGQTFRPETGDVMLLSTSNAGGIKLSVRGEESELLGNRGAIVSEMRLNLSE